MSHTTNTRPPCEFEIFYDRLCHTPLGQLTSAQRAILRTCGARMKRPLLDSGVYIVMAKPATCLLHDDESVCSSMEEQTIVASSPLNAAKVAVKRAKELGVMLALDSLQVWELTGKGRTEINTAMICLALMESDHG